MPSPNSAIVIGGGIAGAAITRELVSRGMSVTLLEKAGQLCSGATWHAAGLVTRFAGSPKLKKIHVEAVDELTALHEAHDVSLHLTVSSSGNNVCVCVCLLFPLLYIVTLAFLSSIDLSILHHSFPSYLLYHSRDPSA